MFDKFSKKSGLENLFYPKSIAVVGASDDVSKIGGYIFSQILKKKEILAYAVNVKGGMVQGVQSFKSISEIARKVDLAIIAIPSMFVLDAVRECANNFIKNIVIISAGFKEVGEEGRTREEELKKLIRERELNVIGPNCLGFLNAEIELNCSFAKDIPISGGTALISQSGAVIDAIIDWSFKNNIGFSKIVSMGNMAGVDTLSMLEYLKEDKKTKSIVFYMETLERGEEFGKVLREVSKVKPVVIIKPGTSDNAKKAIGSHTGSLAQDNILVDTLIRTNNGILVKTLDELYNVMIALKAKLPKNNKLVIVTNAGGPGVIATDVAAQTDFELFRLSDEQKKKFEFLPKEGSLNNPIDILGDAKSDRYKGAIEEFAKIDEIGNIMVLLTPQIMTDCMNIAQSAVSVAKKSDKCIFSCFLGDKEIKGAVDFFDESHFANFVTPYEALVAMNYLHEYNTFNYDDDVRRYKFDREKIEHLKEELEGKSGLLDFAMTKKIMDVFAIHIPHKKILKSRKDIDLVKLDSNKKYVLKGDGEKLVHKKDVGGVAVGIIAENFKEVALNMFDDLEKVGGEFVVTVEEEVKGTEVILGLKSDESLGNFIMFGMGGTYVSVFKDVNFATCPLSRKRAEKLVESSKVYTLLKGFRGSKPIHFEHLYEVLVRMSFLQEIFPMIKEVDLNPIICNEKGVYLVDVKLII